MNNFVYNQPNDKHFERSGLRGYLFPTKNKNLEIYLVESESGHGGKIISETISHIYYILEGEGEFEIDGEIYHATKGQVVEIPKGHVFDYKGKMKMILLLEPPFSPELVKDVE